MIMKGYVSSAIRLLMVFGWGTTSSSPTERCQLVRKKINSQLSNFLQIRKESFPRLNPSSLMGRVQKNGLPITSMLSIVLFGLEFRYSRFSSYESHGEMDGR